MPDDLLFQFERRVAFAAVDASHHSLNNIRATAECTSQRHVGISVFFSFFNSNLLLPVGSVSSHSYDLCQLTMTFKDCRFDYRHIIYVCMCGRCGFDDSLSMRVYSYSVMLSCKCGQCSVGMWAVRPQLQISYNGFYQLITGSILLINDTISLG